MYRDQKYAESGGEVRCDEGCSSRKCNASGVCKLARQSHRRRFGWLLLRHVGAERAFYKRHCRLLCGYPGRYHAQPFL